MSDAGASILLVDDDRLVRETLRNIIAELRPSLRVLDAESGAAALRTLENSGPVQVVISDMRMPEMDGVTLLERTREAHPSVTRILLTAYADLESARSAINQAQIYRFLTKPCPTETLLDAIDDGLREEARLTAELRLLEQTLRGSVKALADILELADEGAFGRTRRVRQHVDTLLDRLGVVERWTIEVAASLWQIGWIALPPETARRLANGVASG